MKKIIFSIMAVAALAACTKSEVQYEPSGEISFAPVAKTLTKSVAGYDGETFDGVFPTDINLYVFANALEGDYSTTNYGKPYFMNANFKWGNGGITTEVDNNGAPGNKTATAGAYAGDPARYWPNVKSLVFAGYSNACNVATLTTKPSMDFAKNELTITGYIQDNTNKKEGANDLMWFPCDGQTYKKQTNEVVAQMKHACSWITINVAKHTDLDEIEYKLDKLELASFAHKGNVVCTKDGATWNTLDNNTTEVYCELTTDNTLSDTPTNFETNKNNFIVIPQTPVNLNVTYTYVSQDNPAGVADLTLTETAPVSLALAGNTKWQAGVHYIYNITITATEILIDPVVVDWATGTTPAVTLPENN